MPGKIFVSYRRDDDPNGAARIRDALTARFGRQSVFMDVDDLLAGLRFDEELAKALAACDVFLAVIGPRWMDLLRAKAASGDRDYVREEIAEALKRKIVVIPVRIGREGQLPPLPRVDELIPEIQDLVHYQKHDVSYERFGRDAEELIAAIVTVRRRLQPERQRIVPAVPWGWISATAASVMAIGYVGAHYAGMPVPWPVSPAVDRVEPRINLGAKAIRTGDPGIEVPPVTASLPPSLVAPVATLKIDEERPLAKAKRKADEEAARRDPIASLVPGSKQFARDRLANGQACSFCPEMVVVPAGNFSMGSSQDDISALKKEFNATWPDTEAPRHRVTLQRPFAVGRFAVTFAEWDACVADGGCNRHKPGDQGWGRDKNPVINVSWEDAKSYADWLSRKTGKPYRLLSEAEREYVARAGTTTAFWWGHSITASQANYDGGGSYAGSPKGEYRQRTIAVDSFEANPWGLYQVHGNVYDWTEDCWHDGYQGAPADGTAWTINCSDNRLRAIRGGSWFSNPQSLRSADRGRVFATTRDGVLGFRLARTLNP